MKILTKYYHFEKLIIQDKLLKEFTVNFQQAIECILEGKNELAMNFRDEMSKSKTEIDNYSKSVCFQNSAKGSGTSLYYLYLQYKIHITEKMSSVLDWILARKSPITSDSIETELFVLADSAAETIERLTLLSKELFKASKKLTNKKSKESAAKLIDEIIEKSKKTYNLSLRMKRKILETENNPASLTHLVFLADMIGCIGEKTRDCVWVASSLICL
ncbi:MAG: hypothetical protein H6680_04240 [Desulfobacteraceae bacterium]|nr:hypothetical protein [Desulfobacteraceae bacterium]